jgi:hypothetical protein
MLDKLEFSQKSFSTKELELIELLKKKEMTRKEILDAGFPFSIEFLNRCCNHGVKIYESDDIGLAQSYGVLA